MQTSTRGVLLKKVQYTGTSIVATVYTRRFGVLAFLIRGFGKKSGKSAAFHSLARVELAFHYRENREVQTCSDVGLISGSAMAYEDPLKASIAIFLAEMLYKSLKEESPDLDLFDFIDHSLELFESGQDHTYFHLIFLMKLTRFFGFHPAEREDGSQLYFDLLNGKFTGIQNASVHTLSKAETDIFSKILDSTYLNMPQLSASERRMGLQKIVEYYQLHLEGFGTVKSLSVLLEVFSS